MKLQTRAGALLILLFAAFALSCSGDGEPGSAADGDSLRNGSSRSVAQSGSSLSVAFPEAPEIVTDSGEQTGVAFTVRVIGDANADLGVGPLDLNAVIDNFGSDTAGQGGEAPLSVDHNDDGSVGPLDYNALIDRFGSGATGFNVYQDSSADPMTQVAELGTESGGGLSVTTTGDNFVRLEFEPPQGFENNLRIVPKDRDGNETEAGQTPVLSLGSGENLPPSATLSVNPSTAEVGEQVSLDASASSDSDGSIVQYDWDWDGDGNFDNPDGSQTETHTYDSTGSFSPTVRVHDDEGETDTATAPVQVNQPNQPPTASLSADQTSGEAELPVQFDASGSSDPEGNIAEYRWDFGDGGNDTTSVAQTSHTYTDPGQYTAEVTVEDEAGATDSDTVEITVEEAEGTTHEVIIENSSFNPSELTIAPGDTVRWINRDSIQHTATSSEGDGEPVQEPFDSGTLNNEDTFEKTFTETGENTYHCEFHKTFMFGAKIFVE